MMMRKGRSEGVWSNHGAAAQSGVYRINVKLGVRRWLGAEGSHCYGNFLERTFISEERDKPKQKKGKK